jgi:hypothetical protein
VAVAARHAQLEDALGRLADRFGQGTVLPGDHAAERRAHRRIPFGFRSLDTLLEGGLVPGEPLVVLGARSTGTQTLALRAVASAQLRGGDVAWIDAGSCFEPLSATRAGIALDRLLVVRCVPSQIAFVTATLARAAAFTLIVVDLGSPLVRGAAIELVAPALPHLRAATAPTLVIAEQQANAEALPALEVRRIEWLRVGERVVGWRSQVTRPHLVHAAFVAFLPLALPPRELVDEGIRLRVPLRAQGTLLPGPAA